MSITPRQYADQLRAKLVDLRDNNRPLQLATLSAIAEMSERIFTRGENTSGQTFQYNSTNPIYVDPADSPVSFEPRGKPKQSGVFKSGKKKGQPKFTRAKTREVTVKNDFGSSKETVDLKTRYFDSYKAFKKAIGQKTDHVHFALTNDLKFDFENTRLGGPKPSAIRINPNAYEIRFDRPINAKIAEGLEAGTNKKTGYGTIFKMNKKEIELFYDVCEAQLALLFSGGEVKINRP